MIPETLFETENPFILPQASEDVTFLEDDFDDFDDDFDDDDFDDFDDDFDEDDFDDDDFDEEPPGSTEDIPSLKYRASTTSDELLTYAIGLPGHSSSPSKITGRLSMI